METAGETRRVVSGIGFSPGVNPCGRFGVRPELQPNEHRPLDVPHPWCRAEGLERGSHPRPRQRGNKTRSCTKFPAVSPSPGAAAVAQLLEVEY